VPQADIFPDLSPAGIEQGNLQLILDRHESLKLPSLLLLQGTADGNGLKMQQWFAASYRSADGKIKLELMPDAPTTSPKRPVQTWTVRST
jgi:hypothetical protein